MKKTIPLLLVGVMLITTTLTGCSKDSGTEKTVNEPKTVKIGVIVPLSGPAANYGEDAVNAYKYTVEKFNNSQSGYKIELVIEDGKCEGKSASSAAQKLIDIDNVQVIVGGFCSAETIAAGTIAQQNKITIVSPVYSSPDIATIGEYVFRFYNDAYVTKKLVEHIQSMGVNNIIVLAENTDVSIGYLKGIKTYFSGNINTFMFQKEEKDFNILAKQIKSKLNEKDFIVFLPSSDESTIGIINAFDKEGILSMMKGRIAGNEIINSVTSYQSLGTKMDGLKTTQLINLGSLPSSAKELEENMVKQFTINSDPLWSILEADAMQLAIDAVTHVGNDGTAIKDYFTAYSEKNPRKGYFGDYYFTPERDAHGLNFLVYEIKDGKLIHGK